MATSNAPKSDSQAGGKAHRHWREIVSQLSIESDHNQAVSLVDELFRALDAESRKCTDQVTPQQKSEGAA